MALSRMPQDISRTDWYYEYKSHLLLVHEVKNDDGSHLRTDQIKIPWRMIEVSRKRRPK
jgi:hypothetical protein